MLPRRRWEDTKLDFKETGWEGVNWIYLAQDTKNWWTFVNTEINLRVPQIARNLTSFSTTLFRVVTTLPISVDRITRAILTGNWRDFTQLPYTSFPRHHSSTIIQSTCVPEQRSRYSDLLQAGRSRDRILVVARFSAPVQTDPGAHPASYTMGIRS